MRRLMLIPFLLAACLERRPDEMIGAPPDAVCSWDIIKPDRGQCIGGNTRYRCFKRPMSDAGGRWDRISCSPYRPWR